MVKRIHPIVLLLTLLFWAAGQLQAANTAVAEVDRDQLYFGESLTLTITLSGKARAHEPDLAPLRDDFAVLGTSTSTRMQIINGDASMEMEWRIQLEPIRSGKLVIPPLRIGPYVTEAIPVRVLPASQMPRGQADTVFIEVEAEPKHPYVQQQVKVTVRLYHAVSLLDGSLDEPAGDDWMVQRLGKNDTRYETRRNGKRYGVVERHYALFPQKSGKLTLPALTFQGRIATQSSVNRFFDQGRAIRRRSQPITLEVRPKPANYPKGAAWLPAKSLELWEDFPVQQHFKTGEPITRTLVLKAQGLLAAQLPDLPVPQVDGLSAYPDQPAMDETPGKQGMQSSKTQKIALVPNRAGTLTLPEIAIPWWNTETDQLEYARLPAHTLRVEAAAGQQPPVPHGTATAPVSSEPAPSPTPAHDTAMPSTDSQAGAGNQRTAGLPTWLWPWIALLLLLGWVSNVFFCLKRCARKPPADPSSSPNRPDTRQARKAWQQAAARGDWTAMHNTLLRWAQAEGYPVTNLGALAAQVNDAELAEEIRALEQARFQPQSQWSAETLIRRLQKGLPAPGQPSHSKPQALPGLYE